MCKQKTGSKILGWDIGKQNIMGKTRPGVGKAAPSFHQRLNYMAFAKTPKR